MKKIKKRSKKKIAIVVVPIVVLCVVSYASVFLRSQANKSAFAYEHYYAGEEYSSDDEEYDNTNSDTVEEDATVIDFEDSTQVITNHDSVILDTDPKSNTVLVNKELSLPKDYVPEDLVVPAVFFNLDYFDEKKQMRATAAAALEELFQAAINEDMSLCAVSGYRSYDRQYDIFTKNIKKQGLEHTLKYSAKPGYSEHQTGLAIDVSTESIDYRLTDSFADTQEGKWLAENAYLYGYIIRYPEDKVDITGYSYEPWHIRYVGKALSLYLFNNNLTLEEYYNFQPSIDYANEISYDNLEEYGIYLDDVKTQPSNNLPEEEFVEEESVENVDTVENETSAEDTIDNTAEDTTEDGNTEEEEVVTPTPKPTKAPKPTKTPTPTTAPTPTAIPTPTAVPTPTVAPTPTPSMDTGATLPDEQNQEEPTP